MTAPGVTGPRAAADGAESGRAAEGATAPAVTARDDTAGGGARADGATADGAALGLVWAQTPAGVIGRDGTLPWHLPEDLARFRTLTSGHPVVMGRATWESLPERFRPLPGRDNVVLSRTRGYTAAGATVVGSLDAALTAVGDREVWVIGGGSLYAEALGRADRVEVTVVDLEVAGDAVAPGLDPARWRLAVRDPGDGWHMSTTGLRYRFETYLPL